MIRDWEAEVDVRPKRRKKSGSQISKSRVKADLGWLDAPIIWGEGRCVWRYEGRDFYPEASDFAVAHRALRKLDVRLQRSDKQTNVTLSDLDRWHQRLRLARRLSQVHTLETHFPENGEPHFLHLVDWLRVESITTGQLPHKPSQALFKTWPASRPVLEEVLREPNSPIELKALVVLIISSAHGQIPKAGDALSQNVLEYGYAYGMPDSAVLTVRLLQSLSPADTHELLSFIESCPFEKLTTPDFEAMLLNEVKSSELLLCFRTIQKAKYCLPKLEFAPVIGDKADLEIQAELTREWEALRERHCQRVEGMIYRSLKYGKPLVASLLAVVVENMMGTLPLVRLDPRRRRKHLTTTDWEQRFLPQFKTFWSILEQICCSRSATVGLQLYADALRESEAAPEPYRPHIYPNEWRTKLIDRLAVRSRLLIQIWDGSKVFGWELARELCQLGVMSKGKLRIPNRADPLWYQFLPKWLRWVGPDDHAEVCNAWLGLRYADIRPEDAYKSLQPVRDVLGRFPAAERGERVSTIMNRLAYHDWNGRRCLTNFAVLYPDVSRWTEATKKEQDKESAMNYSLSCSYVLSRDIKCDSSQQSVKQQLEILCRYIGSKNECEGLSNLPELISLLFWTGGNCRIWSAEILDQILKLDLCQHIDEECLDKTMELPWLRQVLSVFVEKRPRYCLELVREIQHLSLFGQSAKALREFKASLWCPLPAQSDWTLLIEVDVTLNHAIQPYRSLLKALEMPDVVPSGVQRWLNFPGRLEAELAWLEKQEKSNFAHRIENLRGRLQDRATLNATIALEIKQSLLDAWADLAIKYVQKLIEDCYRHRLQELVGSLHGGELDSRWRNATELSVELQSNRKWLRRLLRSNLEGNQDWIRNLPGNVKFLTEFQEKGFAVEPWLATHGQHFQLPSGKSLTLSICDDPIEILRMGSYFKTCLSPGDINSFSAITNAIELNKRVIYAHDLEGKVIGRQLIALNDEWKLVGFYIYSNFSGEEQAELSNCFNGFVRQFAAGCGLELASKGTVPLLFVQDWYNDGIVPWPEQPSDADRQPASEVRKNHGSSGSVGSIWSESMRGVNSKSKAESCLPMLAG